MNRKYFGALGLVYVWVSPLFTQPQLTVVPGGLQGGSFVWDVSVTPDLILGGSTPMAVEMGFRLTGSPLASAVNINPTEWNLANPGEPIFGWEMLSDTDGDWMIETNGDDEPVGLQANAATSEIFAAYGSIDFTTPGPKPFLRIEALGPGNGGSTSSNIEWLGVYAVGHGRIAQLIAGGSTAGNFDTFAGSATQVIPEPASVVLLAFASLVMTLGFAGRRSRHAAHC